MLAATLSRLATASTPWTARDVELEAHRRLAATTYSPPATPAAPVAYLKWLLADADVECPPAQARDAVARADQHTARRRARQARQETTAQQARAVPASRSVGGRAARHIAAAAAARSARRRAADRRADDAARAAAVAAAAPGGGWRTCVGGCHTTSGDVQIRRTPAPLPLCSSCWESINRH